MNINQTSILLDVLEALTGVWNLSENEEWKCLEMGQMKLYKKLCQVGSNLLPTTFLNNRTEITPYMTFTKNGIGGGVINLQDQAIKVDSNCVVLIITF